MQIQQLLQQKRSLFWALQLAGWTAWGGTFYLGTLASNTPDNTYAVYLPIVSTVGMLITLLLRRLYRAVWDSIIFTRVIAILIASYLAAVVWMGSRVLVFRALFDPELIAKVEHEMGVWYYFKDTNSAFMVMLVWSALYFGIKFYLQAQEDHQRLLKANAMAHEAQVKMLHYQLNPHFLFNTLNAISTLILEKETAPANDMVTRLSRFLRYTLEHDPMEKVTVRQEIEALRLYLDIEQVRFGERLGLKITVEEGAGDGLIPSLLLQPLVENAIKYAISKSVAGGHIGIHASLEGEQLRLSVADDGPGLDLRNGKLPQGTGVGLRNCRERLSELYGDRQSFKLRPTEPQGLTIDITLPLELANA